MKGCVKVHSNLLKQDVYVRDSVPSVADVAPRPSSYSYDSLRQVITSNGVEEVLERVPYPITPETVNSQVAGADYHNSLDQDWGAPPRGQNIENLSDIQYLLSNPEMIGVVQERIKSALVSAQSKGDSPSDSLSEKV